MKKVIGLVFILVAFVGCARPVLFDPLGNCRNRAAYCALEAAEKYETVIATGPTKAFPTTISHAQAKAKIDGKWQWLTMMGEYCYVSDQDQFIPLNEWKIVDYIKWLKKE